MAIQSTDQGTVLIRDNFEIAPGYHVEDWRRLDLADPAHVTKDWNEAIKIFSSRIRSRFLGPAQLLIDAEAGAARGTYGFAVLALDFLLIECIQGFREGQLAHNRKSRTLFSSFLVGWESFTNCVPVGLESRVVANALYDRGRCALHHAGSTDRLTVKRRGEMLAVHPDGYIEVNRNLFHQALTAEFDSFLGQLGKPTGSQLRANLRDKMTRICVG